MYSRHIGSRKEVISVFLRGMFTTGMRIKSQYLIRMLLRWLVAYVTVALFFRIAEWSATEVWLVQTRKDGASIGGADYQRDCWFHQRWERFVLSSNGILNINFWKWFENLPGSFPPRISSFKQSEVLLRNEKPIQF